MSVRNTIGLVLWIAVCMAPGFFGSRFGPGEWYAALAKPSWNPPNWIFAPVWTTLYVMMAVAAWLVWRKAGFSGARLALSLFLVHLVVNALWSYFFFGLMRPDLAFIDIVLLWGLILALVLLFWRAVPLAGMLLVPYLVWVTFAACLNVALWQMNQAPA